MVPALHISFLSAFLNFIIQEVGYDLGIRVLNPQTV